MPQTLDDINKEYTQVAAKLGDLAFKRLDLEDAKRHVDQQVNEIDKAMGELRLTRNALMKASAELQVQQAATPMSQLPVDSEAQSVIVDALTAPMPG